MTGSFNKNRK